MTSSICKRRVTLRWISEAVKSFKWPMVALAVLLLFNLFFTPGFFAVGLRQGRLVGSVFDLLKRASPRMIIAFGMTLVIATGGIDVSVGSIAAISGSVAAIVIRGGDIAYLATQTASTVPVPLVLVIALSIAVLCGLFNGFLVAVLRMQPIVATLILMVAGRGAAMLISQGYVLNFIHPGFQFLGSGHFLALPTPIVIAAVVFVIMLIVLRQSPLGLFVQSTGGNQTASYYAGTNTTLVKLFVYAISGLCAGIAGVIITADVRSADPAYTGLWIELEAILAVAIGGTAMAGGRFTLAGTVFGALIIQTLITTLLTRAVPVQHTLILQALVVIIVLMIQSHRIQHLWQRNRKRPSRLIGSAGEEETRSV